jgi:hypothetical protein
VNHLFDFFIFVIMLDSSYDEDSSNSWKPKESDSMAPQAKQYSIPPQANQYSMPPQANQYSMAPQAKQYSMPPQANQYSMSPQATRPLAFGLQLKPS